MKTVRGVAAVAAVAPVVTTRVVSSVHRASRMEIKIRVINHVTISATETSRVVTVANRVNGKRAVAGMTADAMIAQATSVARVKTAAAMTGPGMRNPQMANR